MTSGKEVEFTDLFSNFGKDRRATIDVLYKNYSIEDHKESADSGQPYDSQCLEAASFTKDSGVWDFASYYIFEKGLTVIPAHSHAEAPCEISVSVPVNELMPYLSSSSLLLRL